jgi:integrase
MPRGACVIPYNGKRGRVWRIKYADASGRQVMETIGAERDGVTRTRAGEELQDRLSDVRRKGWRRPAPLTFAEYVGRWFDAGPGRRDWKPSTVAQYRSVRRRLVEGFGPLPLAAIRPSHVADYIAATSLELGAATVGRDVSILHAIFVSAQLEELVETNPAANAERPRVPRRRWPILEGNEISRLERAFSDVQARVVFLTLVLTGLRRSELQVLRWVDVDLLAGVLRVRDSKTETGERSIAIPPQLRDELAAHFQRSAYRGDGELVFCHPERGTVYRAEKFKEALEAAQLVAGVEGKLRPFHDLRHMAITHDAAAGSSAIAVMTKAGHSDMRTTRTYLHLAGVVFQDEAAALERRLLGGVEGSTHLSRPESTSTD